MNVCVSVSVGGWVSALMQGWMDLRVCERESV
jgi:hypothetical protein